MSATTRRSASSENSHDPMMAACRAPGRTRVSGAAVRVRMPVSSAGTMTWDLERAYREHLTTGDLSTLADVGGARSLTNVLSSPELEQMVFGPDPDPHRVVSPFLTFAVAVHRMAERLDRATYVDEWIGPDSACPC